MATPTNNYNLLKPAVGETYNVQTINDNYDKIDAAFTTQAKQALGVMSDTSITTNSGFVTALTVVQNIASFTFKANRKYIIKWDFSYQGNTAGNYMTASIGTAATADAAALTTGITTINSRPFKIHDSSIDDSGIVEAHFNPTTDTTTQIKFLIQITTGSGTARISSAAGQPSTLSIYDLGAQF